jgi:hypothetical protein
MTSKLEVQRANNTDAISFIGKIMFNHDLSTVSPQLARTLHPDFLGERAADLARIYSYYKIKELVVRFSANNAVIAGVLDDITGEGDAPATYSDVSELRSSMVSHGTGGQPPTELYWKPVDTDLWYKCYSAGTGTQELYESGNLYLALPTAGTTRVTVELTFKIVFKGGLDTGGLLKRIELLKNHPVVIPRPLLDTASTQKSGEQSSSVMADRSAWYAALRGT